MKETDPYLPESSINKILYNFKSKRCGFKLKAAFTMPKLFKLSSDTKNNNQKY